MFPNDLRDENVNGCVSAMADGKYVSTLSRRLREAAWWR
jgi:hypothetical protein